jgi:hypothetical protein
MKIKYKLKFCLKFRIEIKLPTSGSNSVAKKSQVDMTMTGGSSLVK